MSSSRANRGRPRRARDARGRRRAEGAALGEGRLTRGGGEVRCENLRPRRRRAPDGEPSRRTRPPPPCRRARSRPPVRAWNAGTGSPPEPPNGQNEGRRSEPDRNLTPARRDQEGLASSKSSCTYFSAVTTRDDDAPRGAHQGGGAREASSPSPCSARGSGSANASAPEGKTVIPRSRGLHLRAAEGKLRIGDEIQADERGARGARLVNAVRVAAHQRAETSARQTREARSLRQARRRRLQSSPRRPEEKKSCSAKRRGERSRAVDRRRPIRRRHSRCSALPSPTVCASCRRRRRARSDHPP